MFRNKKRLYFIALGILVYLVVLLFHTYQLESPAVRASANRRASSSLSLLTMPDESTKKIISLINNTASSIDLVIYELDDKEIELALINAEKRGVNVRVLINQKTWNGREVTANKANKEAFDFLQNQGVTVKYTPEYFVFTHQKTLVIDKKTAIIMTFNLVKKYYKTGRDFGVIDQDAKDVNEIENFFESDWQGQGVPDKQDADSDLVWSPGSKKALVDLIDHAQKFVLIYNEEMANDDIENALKEASTRGVKVFVTMTDSPSWHKTFNSLTQSGVQIHTIDSKDKKIYIHAKMIDADGEEVFLGSENFSDGSLKRNRELGIIFSNKELIKSLESTFAKDFSSATVWQ